MVRSRRSSNRAHEVLFVGRWGDDGPELFRVGKRVRKLFPERRRRRSEEADGESAALAFSERLLSEVMQCTPAKGLAQAFADAQLAPLPDDGFVLSASEVEAWLHAPRAGC